MGRLKEVYGDWSGIRPMGPPVKFRTCQFIHGDAGPNPDKCGAPTRDRSSYCDQHHAVCYSASETEVEAA